MATPSSVSEFPSTIGVIPKESLKFRRPMYGVNYDCLDCFNLSDDNLLNSGTTRPSPWEILKCKRTGSSQIQEYKSNFVSPATPLSGIANAHSNKCDSMNFKDSELQIDFKKFRQRMVVDDDEPKKESIITRYILNIVDEEHGKKYKIPVDAFKKVIDVKTDMYACSDIKVSQQLWSGWPDSCINDDLKLSQLGLQEPKLELSFRAAPVSLCSNLFTKKDENKMMEIDVCSSDEDEYYTDLIMGTDDSGTQDDDSEEYQTNSAINSLVSQNFDDEAAASAQFVVSFQEKFGKLHPNFFVGTLTDAFNKAINKSILKKKLFAVYLHHNESILSNVFCSQLLCTELVVQYLSEHFILWGWDFTLESNATHFLKGLEKFLGENADVIVRLKGLKIDKFPVLMVISGVPGKPFYIHGNVDLDELMSRLMEIVEECDKINNECGEQMRIKTDSTNNIVINNRISNVTKSSNIGDINVANPSKIPKTKQENDFSDY